MVHTGGYLYNFGGLAGFDGLFSGDKVFYARDGATPGTICRWAQGPSMPQRSFFHAAVAWDNKLYVLGGQHSDGQGVVLSSHVHYSEIGNKGVPSAWQTTTPLPEGMFQHGVVLWNGRLYVTGGWTDGELSNRVYSAEINPDGTVGSWVSLLNLPEAGNYTVSFKTRDAVRMRLDGRWLAGNEKDFASNFAVKVTLNKGLHPIMAEYVKRGGQAQCHLEIKAENKNQDKVVFLHDPTANRSGPTK